MAILMRRFARIASIVFIVASLSVTCNKNKKLVKGEEVGAENLCQFVSAGETLNLDLDLVRPVAMAAAEKNRPRAVVHGLERSLLGSGAHREVHSAVALELDLGSDVSETSVADDCDLVLLEPLSNGDFADPFQLNHKNYSSKKLQGTVPLRWPNGDAVKFAQIYGDVDLERPARNSFQSVVELHQRLVPDKRNGLEVLYRSEVTMPLHARYPPLSTETHFVANISLPHLLIYCRGGDNATGTNVKLKEDRCMYAVFGETLPKAILEWQIPSGFPAHSAWVARLTNFSALAGVAAVFIASKLYGSILNAYTN